MLRRFILKTGVTVALLALSLTGCRAGEVEFGPVCGAVTTNSAVVAIGLRQSGTTVRLAVSRHPRLKEPIYSEAITATEKTGRTVKLIVQKLQPDTEYFYAVEIDGKLGDGTIGRFKTFPEGRASFNFAFGNSLRYGRPSQSALVAAAKHDILFFLATGDLFYANISRNKVDLFRSAYRRAFNLTPLRLLCHSVPLVHIWDDHDYGPNDSDKSAPGRPASRFVYQEMVPHYPLILGQGNVAIYQAFSVGRVRFILTDLRSERSKNVMPDGPDKTMMGEEQLMWFMSEIRESSRTHALVIWVSSVPWTSEAKEGADHWGGFAHERRVIANFIKMHRIRNLFIVAGDAHSVAADDGRNSDYADGGGAPLPVIIAAPLDNGFTSVKGGPYSEGVYVSKWGENCYGLVKVQDQGHKITLSFRALNQEQEERLSFVRSYEVPPAQ